MNLLRTALLALVLLLTACSGHDFEGEYELRSNVTDALGKFIGEGKFKSEKVVIGENYIDWGDGQQLYEEVYVDKGEYTSYLVFKKADEEIRLKILDKDTLEMGQVLAGAVSIKLHRVK